MNFCDLSIKVNMRALPVNYGIHGQQALKCHYKQALLGLAFPQIANTQEVNCSVFFELGLNCPLHQLILASYCPFLFSSSFKINRFLLSFFWAFLKDLLKNHQARYIFSLAYLALMKIFNCHLLFVVKNLLMILVSFTILSVLSTFTEYRLMKDA